MSKPTRPRIRLEIRRERLLEKALELSTANQYCTLTMRQLADADGCGKTMLYRAVGNKQEVQQAIERYALEKGAAHPAALAVLRQMAAMGDQRAIDVIGS